MSCDAKKSAVPDTVIPEERGSTATTGPSDVERTKAELKNPPKNAAKHPTNLDVSMGDISASLRSIPTDALHNMLLFCGPQLVAIGLGSTSKHFRSICLKSRESDAVWKIFFKWRCESKLVFPDRLENPSGLLDSMFAVPIEQRRQTAPKTEMQLSARTLFWKNAFADIENKEKFPDDMLDYSDDELHDKLYDELYYSKYRRIHMKGKQREQRSSARCKCEKSRNESESLNELEIEREFMEMANSFWQSAQRPKEESTPKGWCDSPCCKYGKCMDCQGMKGNEGTLTVRCDFCATCLCKHIDGCWENNFRSCDSCKICVCLDCEHILSSKKLGKTQSCSGICTRSICWECAWTVERSMQINNGKYAKADAKSNDQQKGKGQRMIPAIAAPTVAIFNESGGDNERRIKLYGRRNEDERRNGMHANMLQDKYSYYEQRRIAALNRRGEQRQQCHQQDETSKRSLIYVALPFDSERQFSCRTTEQVFCERCARDEVGMVNMRYREGKREVRHQLDG